MRLIHIFGTIMVLQGSRGVFARLQGRGTLIHFVETASMLSSFILKVEANKSHQVMECKGNNDECIQTNSNQPTKIPLAPIPARKRDIADLFYTGEPNLFARFAGTKQPTSPNIASPGGPPPITVDEIVDMINKNQRMPPPLQEPVARLAASKGLHPPDSKTQGETPARLKNHPATEALEKLNSGNIPPEIEAAARAKWSGGPQQGGSSSGGIKSIPPSSPGKKPTAPSHARRDLYARDIEAAIDAYLYERDAPFLFDDGLALGSDISSREATFDDVEVDLYTREAEADEDYYVMFD